jgi:hypothetical protein
MQTSFKVIIPAVLISVGMLIQGSAQAMPNGAAADQSDLFCTMRQG